MKLFRQVFDALYRYVQHSALLQKLYRLASTSDTVDGIPLKVLATPLRLVFRLAKSSKVLRKVVQDVRIRHIASASSLSREEKVLSSINKSGLGLEVGPSHNPITSKKRGFRVDILDHLNAEELREKYRKKNVDVSLIEEVDFVWRGEPYSELIGRIDFYDWIIASHVIEHTPDLIGFLRECEKLLKVDGVLSLVIPDKRYCFDYFVPETTTGALLDAFYEKRVRRTPGQVFDHIANASRNNGNVGWSFELGPPDTLAFEFSEAQKALNEATHSDVYIDGHSWRFTPQLFIHTIFDLQKLGLINLSIEKTFPTSGCEFYVTLKKKSTLQIDAEVMTTGQRIKRLHAIALEKTTV